MTPVSSYQETNQLDPRKPKGPTGSSLPPGTVSLTVWLQSLPGFALCSFCLLSAPCWLDPEELIIMSVVFVTVETKDKRDRKREGR